MMSFLRMWLFGLCMSIVGFTANAASQTGTTNTLLIVGDSLSAGYGIDRAKAWPALLSARLTKERQNITLVNESISGETAAGAARRIDRLLTQYRPSGVIIELGANDGLRGTPVARIKRNLDHMIEQSKKANAAVLLVGMQLPPNYGERYSKAFYQMFETLAKEQNIAIVPFFFKSIMGKAGMFQNDNIHPTEKAQPLLLDTIYPTLKPLLKPIKK